MRFRLLKKKELYSGTRLLLFIRLKEGDELKNDKDELAEAKPVMCLRQVRTCAMNVHDLRTAFEQIRGTELGNNFQLLKARHLASAKLFQVAENVREKARILAIQCLGHIR